jgi:LacI family transcriptional regulator
MKPATIKDVARAAGVGTTTVSRILNNEGYVAQATRNRVEAAIAKLKYRPNVAARSLPGERSYIVGLLFYGTGGPAFSAAVQVGAAAACRAANYHLLVEWLDLEGPGSAQRLGRFLDNVKLDGIVLPPPLSNSADLLSEIEKRNIPYARIAPVGDFQRSSYVRVDNRRAAFEMTKYLLDLGHRKLGFLKGPPHHASGRLRFEGFEQAMKEAQIPLRSQWIQIGHYRFEPAMEVARSMLRGKDRPTAIFASNDSMALGVMSVADEFGLNVPHDLSIAGYDDIPSAAMVWPKLTTIRTPLTEMARRATNFLIDPKLRDTISGIVLDFDLVVRGSTAPPRRHRNKAS